MMTSLTTLDFWSDLVMGKIKKWKNKILILVLPITNSDVIDDVIDDVMWARNRLYILLIDSSCARLAWSYWGPEVEIWRRI